MLFNSWPFVGLVILSAIVYYLPILRSRQLYVLLASSFVFYAYDNLGLLSLLIISGLVNAFASYGALNLRNPRLYATLGVIVNLCILSLFKYGNLISTTFLDINSGIGQFLCTLPLPLGISFYTFSGISLVIDTYRGKCDNSTIQVKATLFNHIKDTLLYICFFPKLLAGPISKSNEFFAEISPKSIRDVDGGGIFKSLVVGYFLKMVIADNLKDFTYWMVYPQFETKGTGDLLLMVFGYSFQMFADFAGYSLIAIGIAAIFGYRLPTNFNFPYISSTFRDFWKRWHITLSQFLMQYLYFSLGGNRRGKFRTYFNLLITMMLGGLWHGAAWSYLVWGTYHGLCLVVERIICGKRDDCIMIKASKRLSHCFSVLFVFTMVSFGWLLFKLPNFSDAVLYIKCIFCNNNSSFMEFGNLFYIGIYSIPVIIYHAMYSYKDSRMVQKYVMPFNYVLYGIMLFLIVTNSGSANSFVYFQF